MAISKKFRDADSTKGYMRDTRRARLLARCLALLTSLNAHSDRLHRQFGTSRGSFAQEQYDLIASIARDIERELAAGIPRAERDEPIEVEFESYREPLDA